MAHDEKGMRNLARVAFGERESSREITDVQVIAEEFGLTVEEVRAQMAQGWRPGLEED